MYYFTEHLEGTGFATMELLEPDGSGPSEGGMYELVAFTRYPFDNNEGSSPLQRVEREVCHIFTSIGFYSRDAVLKSYDTCDVPNGDDEENTCLVFAPYPESGEALLIGEREHHLLLCIQLHRSEMEYAREHGSAELIERLKEVGVYPYSDLDREVVV
jgi:hypothetical protein